MDPGLSPRVRSSRCPVIPKRLYPPLKTRSISSPWSASICRCAVSGTKYKALCPLHDDHNPSLELNPERQSFKCWSCGAGGDIFDFVKNTNTLIFPRRCACWPIEQGSHWKARRRPRRCLEGRRRPTCLKSTPGRRRSSRRRSQESAEVLDYVDRRGLTRQSVERFRLGYAPADRGWLLAEARRQRFSMDMLEQAGLVSHSADSPGSGARAVPGAADLPDP